MYAAVRMCKSCNQPKSPKGGRQFNDGQVKKFYCAECLDKNGHTHAPHECSNCKTMAKGIYVPYANGLKRKWLCHPCNDKRLHRARPRT